MPWARTLPRCSQCRHRRIGAADAGAADDQEQIARAVIERRRNRSGIAARGGDGRSSAPAARALSAIRSAVTWLAGTLTMRSRGRRTFNRSNPAARAISRSRGSTRRPASDDETACGDIAAGAGGRPAPGSLPPAPAATGRTDRRNRNRARNRKPPAWPSPASTQTGRRRQRQRRIGGCADEIACAKSVAVRRGNVARRIGLERRHPGGDATQRFRKRQFHRRDRLHAVQQGVERRIERCQRGRQALGRGHGLGYALNRRGNKQNRVPLAVRLLHSATLTPPENSCK